MIEVVLATCLMGQVCYDAPVVVYQQPSPVVIAPPLYIDYVGVVQPYRSKFYDYIHYRDGKFRKVPIINGYVPGVTCTRYWDGSERIVYNYCHRIRYEDVKDIGKVRTRPRPEPTPAPPRLLPRPVPPEPEKPAPPKPTSVLPLKEIPGQFSVEPPEPVLPGQRNPSEIDEPRVRVRPTYRND